MRFLSRRDSLKIIMISVFVGALISYQNFRYFKRHWKVTYMRCTSPEEIQKIPILIGVITAKKYLTTRARAVFNTWGQTCERSRACKVVFFSSSKSASNEVTPIVSLPDIDDQYPPQNKSLSMLKYMYDHYIDQFQWFMRVDDDIYLKPEKLELFLRSVNSSKPHFIGRACLGIKKERDKLFLGKDGYYCCGGAGMVFSNAALRMFVPQIEYCKRHLLSIHEDIEVSRCVRRFTGLLCTRSLQVADYFHLVYSPIKRSDLGTIDFNAAITLHPVKDARLQYDLHGYFYRSKIIHLQERESRLLTEIQNIDKSLYNHTFKKDFQSLYNISYSVRGSQTSKDDKWHFMPDIRIKDLNNPRSYNKNIKHLMDVLHSVNNGVMYKIKKYYNRKSSKNCNRMNKMYLYKRINPFRFVEYIIDLHLSDGKCSQRKSNVKNWHREVIRHHFQEIEVTESPFTANNIELNFVSSKEQGTPNDSKKTVIHFILPLAGRIETFKSFMKNYEKVCMQSHQATELHISLMNDKQNKSSKLIDIIEQHRAKHREHNIEVIYTDKPFARADALTVGISRLNNDSLLLLIDVDIIFDKELLYRIRMNTVKGNQVYFPIVFNLYDPAIMSFDSIHNKTKGSNFELEEGFWRCFGYGIVSLFKGDIVAVGGFDTSIKDSGKDDVDLYTKFVSKGFIVHRSADISMSHPYIPKICDLHLKKDRYKMCIGSKLQVFASQRQLTNLVGRFPGIIPN